MIIEPIENPESAEFAQICMKWLNSNEPTLTVKDRNGNREKNVTYFRITLKGLDYIYAAPENNMCKNPDIVGIFMQYKGIYSPTEKICVSNKFIKERQELGFYDKKAAQEKFNELFEKTFLPIFVAKYGNKVTGNEDLDYPWKVTEIYLRKGKKGSFFEVFHDLIKEIKLDNWIYENLHTTDATEDEKLTRSMCQAYHSFFKDKEPPRKIKITVMGANKNRNWRSERDNIDIEGKIMTMKVDPCQLASPYVAFEPSTYGVSDFTCKDLQVRKNYSGRIEFPMDDIHTEDILKIEYGRKTIWEKPAKEAI